MIGECYRRLDAVGRWAAFQCLLDADVGGDVGQRRIEVWFPFDRARGRGCGCLGRTGFVLGRRQLAGLWQPG